MLPGQLLAEALACKGGRRAGPSKAASGASAAAAHKAPSPALTVRGQQASGHDQGQQQVGELHCEERGGLGWVGASGCRVGRRQLQKSLGTQLAVGRMEVGKTRGQWRAGGHSPARRAFHLACALTGVACRVPCRIFHLGCDSSASWALGLRPAQQHSPRRTCQRRAAFAWASNNKSRSSGREGSTDLQLPKTRCRCGAPPLPLLAAACRR